MAQHFYLSDPAAAHHVYVGAVHEGSPAIFRLTMDAGSGLLQAPSGAGGAPGPPSISNALSLSIT